MKKPPSFRNSHALSTSTHVSKGLRNARQRVLPIRFLVYTLLCAASVFSATVVCAQDTEQQPDREFRLVASILGFRGIGGEIDGIRNPILQANKGEVIRITIENGEILTHDIAMVNAGVKSETIVDEGATTSITFTAEASDTYYCSIPGHRTAGMEGKFQLFDDADVAPAGRPVMKNGRALNLGFEDGSFEGWSATGDAFGTQPVEGDVVLARTGDIRSQHDGVFWAASSENTGTQATGTLTSVSFTVTDPFISFLVAGGALEDTRAELVRASDDEVLFKISGNNSPALRPVVVDVTSAMGGELFVRLVDNETGVSAIPYIGDNPHAYIAFDDLRFYSERPTFMNELSLENIVMLPMIDLVLNAGLSGADAVAAMTVPDGFTVTLAAAEPDVIRPITFTYDDRGRLWVVEAHTYPEPAPEGEGKDRILIFEDTNGDGTLDSRKIFIENLNLVSGMELGFGGVWVGAAPYFMFIPIEPGTDSPAGPPQILLDGWGSQDTHETLNSFHWGPDGWLYGNHGVFTHSLVGPPGTPEEDRVGLNAGVWRYHPKRHEFEVFAHGTSNPWGLDFNDYGHVFITGCVIPHLYHMIQGGRYQRQGGKHFNPYTYDDIKSHGDHVHWVGNRGPHAGNHRSGEAGGGHAHAGAMFYQGGSWPEEYRDQLFMNNIHGFRTNRDIVERSGSGYIGKHGDDFLLANDTWSQMLNHRYGPDGSVHVIDWYDKNQCHSPNPDVHDKTLGRIFKITHENDEWVQVDLREMSSEALAELQLNKNDWYVRHARRLLQERGPDPGAHKVLKRILNQNTDVTRRLRALWALFVTDGLSEDELEELLQDRDEYVRSWAIQFLAEDGDVSASAMAKLAELAGRDESQLVRLYITSALQRLPESDRWGILEELSARVEDLGDHNLPLMIWYAAEPLVEVDMSHALQMGLAAKVDFLLSFTVRRMVATGSSEVLSTLARALETETDPDKQAELIKGLNEMMGGTR
jgi:putative membrane-bound dehydrogenase-like protein